MPEADVFCEGCGFETVIVWDIGDCYPDMECSSCRRMLRRRWVPVGVGRVRGAGGSPGRFGRLRFDVPRVSLPENMAPVDE